MIAWVFLVSFVAAAVAARGYGIVAFERVLRHRMLGALVRQTGERSAGGADFFQETVDKSPK